MGHNQLDVFYEKYQDKLNQPIVESFLREDKNYFLFKNAIIDPTEENKHRLDLAFKQHYKQVKMISYISKLIYFYSIDFDKKISLNNQRQLLNLDTPISTDENNTTSKLDILTSSKEDLTYLEFENIQKDIKEHISNDILFASLNLLSDKQLEILKLIYIVNYNNKEVAKLLGESEQTVSYNHKKAIKKLRNSMNFKKWGVIKMMAMPNFKFSSDNNFEVILNLFLPKIKKSLKNTPFQEREDLEQEIKLKIYEKIDVFDNFSAPGFFDFIEGVNEIKSTF